MKYIISFLLVLAIIISCRNSNKKSTILSNPDDMPVTKYTINIDRDTTIETKNGALLKIPKGALSTDKGNTVTLEIKEAYSLLQMIQAGLTTQSNGQPLSSGGMIYINAAAGQNVTIKQAIKVAIPTNNLQKDMQLFKGEKDANGNINWNSPVPLPENEQLNSIETGRQLFQSNCASCHAIGRDLTGPDLAHFPRRIPNNEGTSGYWYHRFNYVDTPYSVTNIPSEKIDTSRAKDSSIPKKEYHYSEIWTDLYSCNLIYMYGGNKVNLGDFFSNLGYHKMDAIYSYIQNESDKNQLPLPEHAYLYDCVDSCGRYNDVKKSLRQKRAAAIDNNGKLVERNSMTIPDTSGRTLPPDTNTIPAPPVNFEERVSPQNYESVYYQFTIESFGWYNCDILFKGLDGVEESELWVRITGQYTEKIKVYLILPSVKGFIEGGPTGKHPDEYAFAEKNGKMLLPQNKKGYILAITETESSVAYSIQEFTAGWQQTIALSLKVSGNKEFNATIEKLGFDDLRIKAKDSKNSDEIRKTDAQLKDAEKLKPKNCNCDCSPIIQVKASNSADIMYAQ
jgi:hypothetical protein